MLERYAEHHLVEWYRSRRRKPLVLRGARQVGKSTLVRQFAAVEQVEHFLKRSVLYQVVDAVSEIGQLSFFAFDVAEGGFVCDDSFESFRYFWHIGDVRDVFLDVRLGGVV